MTYIRLCFSTTLVFLGSDTRNEVQYSSDVDIDDEDTTTKETSINTAESNNNNSSSSDEAKIWND